MDSDKEMGLNAMAEEKEGEKKATHNAPRARNRTVMLTPDVTGQVRARLAQSSDPLQNPMAPAAPQGFGIAPQQQPQSVVDTGGFKPVRNQPVYAQPQAQTNQQEQQMYNPQQQYQPQQQQAYSNPNRGAGISYTKITPVVGFLVSFDKNPAGEISELRSGRIVVSSDSTATGNVLYIDDPSVSVGHAILRISAEGEIQVLDQLSEFGTKIIREGSDSEEELSGEKSSLDHGDTIKFGDRKFHVCLLSLPDAEEKGE